MSTCNDGNMVTNNNIDFNYVTVQVYGQVVPGHIVSQIQTSGRYFVAFYGTLNQATKVNLLNMTEKLNFTEGNLKSRMLLPNLPLQKLNM